MDTLSISLFGQFEARLNDKIIPGFRTRKVQALLIYLVREQAPQRRESLMELLWPGMPDRSARKNLRQVIYNLRQSIPDLSVKEGDSATAVPLLLTNRQTIQLNPQAAVTSDADQFTALLQKVQTHSHVDLLTCHRCRQDLETAVSLYRADFLTDFYLDDSNPFEAWAEAERQTLRRKALDALETLTAIYARQKDFPQARAYAERQLDIDDLRESAYRQLMEILALDGQREEALALYERCRRLLAEELGMAPTKRTSDIYNKIVAGDLRFDRQPAQGVHGYELKEEIGQGGYGTIYRAIQPSVGRDVAVKVIRRKYTNNPKFIRRFEAEAQTIARLEHPYIVPLYDYWRDPEGAYLVMRLLRGQNLLTSLEGGPWPVEEAAKMLDQIAAALSAAHQQGVVHRDIKPANILFDEMGNAYLTDFGIAKNLLVDQPLTEDGALMGTLDYISPEQLLNEGVSPQSDIYSLGAVMYETLTGEKPFSGDSLAALMHQQLQEPIPLVSVSRPDIPPQVDEVIRQATAKLPDDRYADVLALAEAFRRAVRSDGFSRPSLEVTAVPAITDIYNPYKGLRAFQEADADDFYGRELLVEQLVGHLADSRFLALVGPSGSGKSSVVKAGLIPALRQAAIPGSDNWFVAEMVPGDHPLEELELALLPIAVDPPPDLVEPMRKDERGMLRTIRRILPDEEDAQLLLVIDQFEELFTLVDDDERRRHFLNSLLTALNAPRSPLRIVVTLRADFYDRPLQIQPIAELFKQHTEIILPLTQEELTWAIQEPARRVGVSLEPSAVTAMLTDVADQPGALPLLQYALTELFEERQDNVMTLAAYRALGGVSGALAQRAEDLYASFDEAGQEAIRQLFLRLVTLGEGVEDTRRRVRLSELEALSLTREPITDNRTPVTEYGRYRLLTFDHDPTTREPTVEVAHEALLREWPRLRRWLQESRDDVRLQRSLAAFAAEWVQNDQAAGFLLRGSRLDLFAGWAATMDLALTPDEQAFLAASVAAREQREAEERTREERELETARQLVQEQTQRAEEQTRSARRLRVFAAGLSVILLLAVGAAWLAVNRGREAQSNANLAATSEAAALAQANQRATAQADAEVERMRADEERDAAISAEATAVAEGIRADEQREAALAAEAIANTERETAVEQAQLARSRELAGLAVNNLAVDTELSMLLSLEALDTAYTAVAENALHLATLSSRVRQRFSGQNGLIFDVAFSPDGRYLASAAAPPDSTVRLWDASTGEELFQVPVSGFDGGNEPELTFSADGRQMAVLNPGETVKLSFLGVPSGEELATLALPLSTDLWFDYALSPDWTQAAFGFEDGTISVWDVAAGEPLYEFVGHDAGWLSLHYSEDGARLITTSDDGTTKTWDTTNGQAEGSLTHNSDGWRKAVSQDGGLLAIPDINEREKINIWDLKNEDTGPLSSLVGHNNLVMDIIFSADGSRVATVSRDQTARIWDTLTGEELVTLYHGDQLISVAFNEEGTQLLTGDLKGNVRVWDITPTGAAELLTFPATVFRGLAVSPDGSRLATTTFDGTTTIWDSATGELLLAFADHSDLVMTVAFSPDGKRLVTASTDGTAIVRDADSGETLLTLDGHGEGIVAGGIFRGVLAAAFSPDGSRLATAGADQTARLWDAESGEELLRITGHSAGLTSLAFSPDGRVLATGSDWPDATVKLWDAATGQELFTLPPSHADRVWNVAFSPDGTLLATAGSDSTAKIWELDFKAGTGRLLATLVGHTSTVLNVEFSPDGQYLATSIFGEIKLWDLTDLSDGSVLEVLSLPGSRRAVFHPQENTLIIAFGDGTVRLITLSTDKLATIAEERLTRTFTAVECQQYRIDPCPAEQ